MSLSAKLIDEIRALTQTLTDGRHDLPLSGGRMAICFKGEDAEAQARTCRTELPATHVVIGTYHEPGIYCLVL